MKKPSVNNPKRVRRMFRLLPMTVTMLSLLLIMKANDLYFESRQLSKLYAVRDAMAAEKKEVVAKSDEENLKESGNVDGKSKPESTHGEGKSSVESDAEGKSSADAQGDAKSQSSEHGENKSEDAGHADAKDAHGEAEDGHGTPKPVEEPKTFGTGKSTVKEIEALKAKNAQPQFTKTELDILQNLSKRRDALDARERELEVKSKILDATDKRINDRIVEIKILQTDLLKVLEQYNEKQDEQIKSLVKIYESMKPDEAAAIFNELEMPILLEVIGKMSERKVAPVLANMKPKRARDVTQELAEKRKKSVAAGAATAN